jgi:hypothetical protein
MFCRPVRCTDGTWQQPDEPADPACGGKTRWTCEIAGEPMPDCNAACPPGSPPMPGGHGGCGPAAGLSSCQWHENNGAVNVSCTCAPGGTWKCEAL